MKNKLLIIGNYISKSADTCTWDGNILNLIDYETIIIDTCALLKTLSITSGHTYRIKEWPEKIVDNIQFIKKKIIESTKIDIKIYALFCPNSVLHMPSNDSPFIPTFHTNDWLPITVETYIEDGSIIEVQDKNYQEYFNRLKNWRYYLLNKPVIEADKIKEYYLPNLFRLDKKIIAVNKLGKPLAIEYIPQVCQYGYKSYYEQKSRIILLPPNVLENTNADIETIIHINKMSTPSEIPEWINLIQMPNEKKYLDECNTLEGQLIEKRKIYKKLVDHKRLLYENSYSLQNTCEITIQELGIGTKPSIVNDEFIIEDQGNEILVEVKGKNKSIDKDDLGHLVIDIGQHFKETGNSIKGLFIGNGLRNLPIEKREKGNNITFPKEIIKAAEDHNIGLLTSVELFNAYCMMLQGKLKKSDFAKSIFNSKGIIKF